MSSQTPKFRNDNFPFSSRLFLSSPSTTSLTSAFTEPDNRHNCRNSHNMLLIPPPTPLPSPFSHTLPVSFRLHLLPPLSVAPASTAAAVTTYSQPFHLEVVSDSEDDVLPSHSVRYDFSPLLSFLSASPYFSVPDSSSLPSASLDPTDFRLAESYRAVPLPLWHSLLKALTSSSASAVSELGASPSLAYAVVLWLQKHNLCFSYELLYSILINSLGRSDKLYEAFLLSHRHTLTPFTYNALICACARHLEFDKAFNLLHRMRLDGYQPDFINYSTLVQCLIRGKGQGGCRMEGSVLDRICAEVEGDRIELDSQLFNDVIIGFAKAGDADAALKYLAIAQGCGLSVKMGSFVAVVSVLGDFGRVEEAEAVFEEMKEGGLKPKTRAYNGLLKGYVKAGSLKDAEFIVSEMERNEVLPDEHTYSILVDAYIREDRWESAQVLLKELEARDLKLSTLMFGRMVVSYRDKGEWQKTFQVLREMKKCGVRPDRHFYNVMIDTFGKYKCLDHVMTTFERMLHEGIEPDNVTWNTLIDCHTKSEKCGRAEELFQEMRERGSSPCTTTYNIMINCLGQQQKWDDVKRLFSEMQSEGLIPNVVTYTTLIDVFGKSGRFDDAVECIENMKLAGLNPSSTMYNALINGYAQRGLSDKALDTFKVMTADGLMPSLLALNSLINAFGEDRRDVEAFTVLQYMKENDLKPDVVTFTTLMKALIRVDKFHKVPDVYEEMILSGCTPDKKAKDMFRSALRYMKLTLKPT